MTSVIFQYTKQVLFYDPNLCGFCIPKDLRTLSYIFLYVCCVCPPSTASQHILLSLCLYKLVTLKNTLIEEILDLQRRKRVVDLFSYVPRSSQDWNKENNENMLLLKTSIMTGNPSTSMHTVLPQIFSFHNCIIESIFQ